MRKSRLSQYKQERLLELFIAGSTARIAAELVGVHRNTAAYYFHRLRVLIAEHVDKQVILPFLTEVISRIRPYAEYAASVCSHSTPYWVVRDYKTIAIR
ncbi:hypothetical protein ABMZ85_19585, partial [Morganella morganii]